MQIYIIKKIYIILLFDVKELNIKYVNFFAKGKKIKKFFFLF